MANYKTNIRGNGQLREGSVYDANINDSAAIALSKLAESVIVADGSVAFTGSQSLGGFNITNLGSPVAKTDAANKGFVLDNARAHTVTAVSDANVVLSGLLQVDGYQLTTGDVVLLTAQTDPIENGIWLVTASDWSRDEALSVGENAGSFFAFVKNGSTYGGTAFVSTCASDADVVGTNDLSFKQFTTDEVGVFNNPITIFNASDESNAVEIYSGATASSSKISLYDDGVYDSFSVKASTSNISILTNDTTGFVGINVIDPEYGLDVAGDINFSGILRYNGASIGDSFENYDGFIETFVATEGQTEFTLSSSLFNTEQHNVLVIKNGVILTASEYSVAASVITVTEACTSEDEITIRPFNLATVISTVESVAGDLSVPGELQVGENSVHITEQGIVITSSVSDAADLVDGQFYGGTQDPTDDTRVNYNGNFYASKVYNAVWNDIAECMPSDGTLEPGDLAAIDMSIDSFRVTKYDGTNPFIGVVASDPGMIVGENDSYENKIYIVLKGMIYTDKIGTFDKGAKLYIESGAVKAKGDVVSFFEAEYFAKVIESHNDKVRLFI